MRVLIPCQSCNRHTFSDERACPFCGASTKRRHYGIVAGGAILVAATACGGAASGTSGDTVEDGAVAAEASSVFDAQSSDGAEGRDQSVAFIDATSDATIDEANPALVDAPGDAAALDASDADSSDAADAQFGSAPPYCCIYRSPPGRAVWT